MLFAVRSSSHQDIFRLLSWSGIIVAALLLVSALQESAFPRILSITSRNSGDENAHEGLYYAVGLPSTSAVFDIRISAKGWLPPPSWYLFLTVGKLDRLSLNGVNVFSTETKSHGRIGQLFREEGDNVLRGRMSLKEVIPLFVFGLRPSLRNLSVLSFFFVQLIIVFLWAYRFKKNGWFSDRFIWLTVLSGVFLRVLYGFATPIFSRSYDFRGHIDYIRFVADHWSLPVSNSMWEAYQMPLYYVSLAPLLTLMKTFGFTVPESMNILKITSVVLTVLTLFIAVRLAERFFHQDKTSQRIASMLLAVFPGFIYLSSQINNDVLVTLMGVLWSYSLLEASSKPDDLRKWIFVGLACGCGILAKMSAAPWVAVSVATAFFLTRNRSLILRLQHAAVIILGAFLTGGWLYLYRSLTEEKFGLIANAFNQWGANPLPLSLAGLLSFNPLRLLREPFLQFSAPAHDAHYYLEDIARTAHFGSVELSPEAAMVYLLILIPLACFLRGVVRAVKQREYVFLLQVVGIVAAGMLMRLQYPFPPSQHFRYITAVLIPCVFLVTQGSSGIRFLPFRALAHAGIGAYAVVSATIVFAISITG